MIKTKIIILNISLSSHLERINNNVYYCMFYINYFTYKLLVIL